MERLPIDFPPALRAHVGRHLLTMLTARFGDQRYLADFRSAPCSARYPLSPPAGASPPNDAASEKVARARRRRPAVSAAGFTGRSPAGCSTASRSPRR